MAESEPSHVPTTTTEEGLRRIMREVMRTEATVRNPLPRRRRHVTLGGGSGTLHMFRLEEELQVGRAADARLMDACGPVTRDGEIITVMDDQRKWFGRGDPAPNGDYGGDERISGSSYSNTGWARKVSCSDQSPAAFYSIVSMGTWYRWIEGVLSDNSWVVQKADIERAWDGDLNLDLEFDRKFIRDDAGGSGDTVTLDGACTDTPTEGLHFKAVFDEIERLYKVVTLCCPPPQ